MYVCGKNSNKVDKTKQNKTKQSPMCTYKGVISENIPTLTPTLKKMKKEREGVSLAMFSERNVHLYEQLKLNSHIFWGGGGGEYQPNTCILNGGVWNMIF